MLVIAAQELSGRQLAPAESSVHRYFPQVWLNYKRKSTIGWSVSNAMTDMSGGLFSLAQQSLDAYALKVCLPGSTPSAGHPCRHQRRKTQRRDACCASVTDSDLHGPSA